MGLVDVDVGVLAYDDCFDGVEGGVLGPEVVVGDLVRFWDGFKGYGA